jgi:hypothetical protein
MLPQAAARTHMYVLLDNKPGAGGTLEPRRTSPGSSA